ncbi:hypothetical protein ACFQLX_19725 [Streptomyces polyrhachis]|uniref:Uncharacterized protein n=1 Tax=Streptomyces polyrhachis TaxID=1282885 RepID=A0ABW2GHV6_9ACTN
MSLVFIGVDPNSEVGQSPTVWVDTDTQEFVIQGWRASTEDEARCYAAAVPGHAAGVPAHEALVRVPARMVHMLREACNALDAGDPDVR